jgi:hypothetical protein
MWTGHEWKLSWSSTKCLSLVPEAQKNCCLIYKRKHIQTWSTKGFYTGSLNLLGTRIANITMLVCRCTKVTTKLRHCCKYKLREMLTPGSEYNPRTVSTVVKMDLSFKFGIPNEGSNTCVLLRYEHRGARLHGWSPACIASSHLENNHPTGIITSTKCKSALVQAVTVPVYRNLGWCAGLQMKTKFRWW